MTLIDDARARLTSRRKWPWLVAALLIAVLGHVLDEREMSVGDLAIAGARLTHSLHDRLQAQQPGVVLDRYNQTMLGPGGNCHGCAGVEFAFGIVRATPSVAAQSWASGAWFDRLVLLATFGIVLLVLLGMWTDATTTYLGRAIGTVIIVMVGPMLGAFVCTLVLLLLKLLTIVVGDVLSGFVLVAGMFGGLFALIRTGLEVLKHADELEENAGPVAKRIAGLFGSGTKLPPGPPPSTPPAA